MIAGRRAFGGRSGVERMAAILSGPPDPIQDARPDVPPPLAAIVERCLARSPEDRYASTADLARDLRGLRDGPSRVTAEERVRPRRGRVWPAAVAVLLVAGALGAVGLATWPRWFAELSGSKPAASKPRQIVVLPFTSDTGDDTDKFLAAGLSDAVTGALYRLQRLDRTCSSSRRAT